ncbi:MAG: hypothetical protein HPY69_01220 [Armatimonadetes bacterium]|nr:hypothetical protein [Armatimonadota bacterium]
MKSLVEDQSPPSVSPRAGTGLVARLPRPVLIGVGAGLLVTLVTAVAVVWYDATVAVAAPFVVAALYLTIRWPLGAYIVCLCMVSIVPVENSFLRFWVPYWTQAMIPLLVIGALLPRLRARDEQRLDLRLADVLVLAFIMLGYLAIFREQGRGGNFKWYTNEVAFPILLYFVARWLPIGRKELRLQLRWQLLFAGLLAAEMVLTPLIGRDLFYGYKFVGLGHVPVGVSGIVSDTVAYISLWLPLFLYAAATNLPGIRQRHRRFWQIVAVLSLLATLATTERTGALSIPIVGLICLTHRRLRRYVLWGLFLLPPVLFAWLVSPIGGKVQGRLSRLRNEGEGFERRIYRQKAWNVIKSPDWNWLHGTGFGGLTPRSRNAVSETEWVYDYNWQDFRPVDNFASRPIHCSPLSVLGEYGLGGMALLIGVVVCIIRAFLQAYRLARDQGLAFDSTLCTAMGAALAAVLANAMYHNTDQVIQVIMVLWSAAGLIIGHPEAFVVGRDEMSESVVSAQPAQLGRVVRP